MSSKDINRKTVNKCIKDKIDKIDIFLFIFPPDLQRQLAASEEKSHQLEEDKEKMVSN